MSAHQQQPPASVVRQITESLGRVYPTKEGIDNGYSRFYGALTMETTGTTTATTPLPEALMAYDGHSLLISAFDGLL